MEDVRALDTIDITLSVHIGSAIMPMHQFLRLGRGAIIELDKKTYDEFLVLANDKPFAKGEVLVGLADEQEEKTIENEDSASVSIRLQKLLLET